MLWILGGIFTIASQLSTFKKADKTFSSEIVEFAINKAQDK
jgi:hypothetical protein